MDNKIKTRIELEDGFSVGLAKFSANLKEMSGSFQSIGLQAGAMGAAITGALALMGRSAMQYGEEINKLSIRAGISAESMSTLGYVAEQQESSIQELSMAFKFLDKAMVSAKDGTGDAARVFRDLGINIVGANGNLKSSDAMFREVVLNFGNLRTEADKSAAAMALFGRAGYSLKPLLNTTSEEFIALEEEARKLGLELSGPSARAFDTLGDSLTAIKKAFVGVAVQITSDFMPQILFVTTGIKVLYEHTITWMKQNQELVKTIVMIAAGLGAILTAVGTMALAIVGMLKAWGLMVLAWQTAGAVFTFILGGFTLANAGIIALIAGIAALLYAIYKFRDNLREYFKQLMADTQTVASFLLDKLGEGLKNMGIKGQMLAMGLASVRSSVPELTEVLRSAGTEMALFGEGLINQLKAWGETLSGPMRKIYDEIVSNVEASYRTINSVAAASNVQVSQGWVDFKEGWNKATAEAGSYFMRLGEVMGGAFNQTFTIFGQSMAKMLVEGKSFTKTFGALFKNMSEQIIAQIIAMTAKMAVLKAVSVAGPLGGLALGIGAAIFGGMFAEGGRVTRPSFIGVGEGGEAESIVPDSKAKTFAMGVLAGGGGSTFSPAPAQTPAGGNSVVVNLNMGGQVFNFSGSETEDVTSLMNAIGSKMRSESIEGVRFALAAFNTATRNSLRATA